MDVIVFLLALLFVYAAMNKLMDFQSFQAQLGKSPLITEHASWISWVVPFSEIIISIGLFIPQTRLVSLYASFTLMFMFTAYIAFILTFSPYVPCSCGGILDKLGWTEHLIFNIVFTLIALTGTIIQNKRKSQPADATTPIVTTTQTAQL